MTIVDVPNEASAAEAAGGAPGGPRDRRAGLQAILAAVAGVVVFLGLWEFAVWAFSIEPFKLPAPSDVLREIANHPEYYARHARATVWEAFLGFSLALVIAMAAATVMAHSRLLEQAVLPLAVLIQVTPVIAYAPAVVIWLGFGLKPIVFITSLVCLVPFLINAVTGLRSIDPATHELLRSVNASRREVYFRLRVPHALPYLFSAARISVGLALIGAVLGEFFAGVTQGLGYSIKVAQNRADLLYQLWGSIFVLAAIGATATLLISAVERVALRWHSSQTA